MALKLYGTPKSPFFLLVAAVLLEKQVPFEVVLVDIPKGEIKTPEYLRKHPFGQVPYIVCNLLVAFTANTESHLLKLLFDQDDDGFIVYESKAICYYIALKYPDKGTPLLPTGVKADALYQQAVFTQVPHFDDHIIQAARDALYGKR